MLQFTHTIASLCLLLLVLPACPSSSSGNEELGSGEGESGGAGESDATGESAGESSGESSGEGETGGEPSLEQVCTAVCENYELCLEAVPDCMTECLAQIQQFGEGECFEADVALFACLGSLTCEELLQFYEGEGEPYPCEDQEAAQCHCGMMAAGGENPGECSFSYSCTGTADVHAIECDGTTCSCLENGVEVATCDAAEYCADYTQIEAANACCGWALFLPPG